MNGPLPIVRYMIACEDIRINPDDPRKVTLVNVVSTIRSREQPAYPLLFRELCIFVQLTECHGGGEVDLQIVHEESDQTAYPGPDQPWKVQLPNDPLEAIGLPFRIRNILFPLSGPYSIQFWYNRILLAHQSLLLR